MRRSPRGSIGLRHRRPERLVGRPPLIEQEFVMSKTGRKRRARKKKKANHGKRPNA
jgi:hypothetical protein